MRRRAAAALVSLLMISLLSLGFGGYMIGSRAIVTQPDPSTTNNIILNNSTTVSVDSTSSSDSLVMYDDISPIISVSLTAGVTQQPNGTGKCVLLSGFDSSSCVSTSVGVWKNAILSIETRSSDPHSLIKGVQLTNGQQVNISEWSASLYSQTATELNSTSLVQASNESSLLSLYPVSSVPLILNAGQIFSYAVVLADGQILTGSVVSQ